MRMGCLSQLAILTSSPVIARNGSLFSVNRFLTGHTESDAWNCFSPSLGDCHCALVAVGGALSLWQIAASAADFVFETGINLLLNGSILRKSTGHTNFPWLHVLPINKYHERKTWCV